MTDYPVQPALEAVLVAALRASSSLDSTFGDRISTKLPGAPTEGIRLTLRRSGGHRTVEPWVAAATFEFGVWGDHGTEPALEVAANLAESVVLGLLGPYDAAVITGVEPVLGPRNIPDPETGRPRYLFESRIFAHPAE